MSDPRLVKANELRTLARDFRAKARATELDKYIDLLLRSAKELEQLAAELERQAVPALSMARVRPMLAHTGN